jgi:signal peptidase II
MKFKKFHNYLAVIIALVVLFLDQLTKQILNSVMYVSQSFAIIKNVFHITLVHNIGAGFGILKGQRIFFLIFSIFQNLLQYYEQVLYEIHS